MQSFLKIWTRRLVVFLSVFFLLDTVALQYAEAIDALTKQEAEDLAGAAWEAFLCLAEAQGRLVADIADHALHFQTLQRTGIG